jgi:hypothetical protein
MVGRVVACTCEGPRGGLGGPSRSFLAILVVTLIRVGRHQVIGAEQRARRSDLPVQATWAERTRTSKRRFGKVIETLGKFPSDHPGYFRT